MDQLPERLVLYDGLCGLCDRTVQFFLDHDRDAAFHFAPLQGETAKAVRARHPEVGEDVDSVIYLERDGATEKLWVRSHAVFQMARHLDAPHNALSVLSFFPQALTDAGYDLVASVRYKVFGRLDQCRVPRPEERKRFLP